MLTLSRVLLPRGAAVSVGRLFATSVPRWNVPTSVKGTTTAPLDAIRRRRRRKPQLANQMTARQFIHNAQLKANEERIAAKIAAKEAVCEAKRAEKLADTMKREEQAAAQAASKSAEAEAAALLKKERLIAIDVARKAKRADKMSASRARKERLIAKRKENRAQLRARGVARKEQAAARAASKSAEAEAAALLKKLRTTPWLKHGKLPPRPLGVYMDMHLTMQPDEKILMARKRISAEYKALTAEQRLPYEEKAAANLKVREAALAKIQGLKADP